MFHHELSVLRDTMGDTGHSSYSVSETQAFLDKLFESLE